MIISLEKGKDNAVLKIEGRLDTTTAPQLENEINKLLSETKNLILDMAKLEYISSAGLRVILSTQKKVGKDGSLKIVSVCDPIMEVFEITGFVDILTIE